MEAVTYIPSPQGLLNCYTKKIQIGPGWPVGWLSYIFGWQIINVSRDFEFPGIANKYYVSVCLITTKCTSIHIYCTLDR